MGVSRNLTVKIVLLQETEQKMCSVIFCTNYVDVVLHQPRSSLMLNNPYLCSVMMLETSASSPIMEVGIRNITSYDTFYECDIFYFLFYLFFDIAFPSH